MQMAVQTMVSSQLQMRNSLAFSGNFPGRFPFIMLHSAFGLSPLPLHDEPLKSGEAAWKLCDQPLKFGDRTWKLGHISLKIRHQSLKVDD